MPNGQRQKQPWEISAHVEWSDFGWFIWYFCLCSVTFEACHTRTLPSATALTIEVGAVQAFLVPSDYANDLPSEWWSQALGFDVLLLSNWLEWCLQTLGQNQTFAFDASHPTSVETFPGDIACVSWLHLVMFVCHFKYFQNQSFSEATGRPKDSGPLSPCAALPGDAVPSTAEVPKAPPNAAYRLISMLESAALALEAMRVLNGDFYEILCMFFAYFAWISWRNPLWSTTEWIYGQKSKHVKIRCDSQWHLRLRLNRFITQVPSGASLSPSCEAPATKKNTKLISII